MIESQNFMAQKSRGMGFQPMLSGEHGLEARATSIPER
jgi:hypothetical protein